MMRHTFSVCAALMTILAICGCEMDQSREFDPTSAGPSGTPAPTPPAYIEAPTPTPEPTPVVIVPTPTPAPAATTGSLPYGVPVPNKTGFVTSPYAPDAGLVDVRGFPPNTEVKDPYSGKVFLVP